MIISFIGKGGVGKTTITLNLGAALATYLSQRVLVIDGNTRAPNLSFLLELKEAVSLFDLITDPKNIVKANTEIDGLKVISSPIGSNAELDFEVLKSLLSFFNLSFNFILIDTPPSFTSETLTFMELSDYSILILNPEPLSVIEAYRALQIASRMNVKLLGIIVNKFRQDAVVSLEYIRRNFSLPILAVIPEDPMVQTYTLEQKPFSISNPSTPAGRALMELASYLTGRKIEVQLEKRGIIGTFFSLLKKLFT
ncbi:MAG: MinD/ParA family protein [Candidatus Nanoarchaeia archaeon]|nr:MinD/ParA family protein [Candidatus Haiyanarchaeum thermophilum]MCW1302811.1 MinD/ParA family protein [Candidatus Haiyanarchaeum thermophilum]MCW1303492.1 MinD/ParA family protein [Candidatus Haiyanarchaeum thermophilum]MCW1306672.1 MinD/ParA family protein [Candidatus Haiyanarchaeum thermophilum]MCW1307372.1 MinD/ParA family protein [Candidatus Haiyanarchaeum thermophilum]